MVRVLILEIVPLLHNYLPVLRMVTLSFTFNPNPRWYLVGSCLRILTDEVRTVRRPLTNSRDRNHSKIAWRCLRIIFNYLQCRLRHEALGLYLFCGPSFSSSLLYSYIHTTYLKQLLVPGAGVGVGVGS